MGFKYVLFLLFRASRRMFIVLVLEANNFWHNQRISPKQHPHKRQTFDGNNCTSSHLFGPLSAIHLRMIYSARTVVYVFAVHAIANGPKVVP